MRFWRKSTPFFTLISLTFSRYWKQSAAADWLLGLGALGDRSCDVAHLTHLQLEETTLLLHVLGDLSAAELGADHAVLPRVLPLLLLDLGPADVTNMAARLLTLTSIFTGV